MIRIEVTGDSIPEVADKLLAIGSSLRSHVLVSEAAASGSSTEAAKPKATRKAKAAEGKADETVADTADGTGSTTETAEDAPASSGSESPTEEPTASRDTTPSDLDFDKDVAPVVLDAVAAIGKERVVAIIGEFGAARASEVSPAQWPELVERLKGEQA